MGLRGSTSWYKVFHGFNAFVMRCYSTSWWSGDVVVMMLVGFGYQYIYLHSEFMAPYMLEMEYRINRLDRLFLLSICIYLFYLSIFVDI